jgi:DNA-binding beta-propeller fold protein YncE
MNRTKLMFYGITFGLLLYSTGFTQFEEFCAQYDLLTTIAGTGKIGGKGVNGWKPEYEGGSAPAAELSRPHFAMADSAGNIFIADKDAHAIRKISPDGIITTVAGTNVAGDNGDGPGTEHQLSSPNGLWVTAEGTVYILDLGNNKIRRLDSNGNLVTLFTDPDGISIGRGIWVSPDETEIYYASGTRVKKWTTVEIFFARDA